MSEMQVYKHYRPTQFDTPGLCGDSAGISDWLVIPCGRNRDSDALQESNFHVALEMLGGESDTVQVHRFGHWACGWFEIIVIDPSHAATLATAEEIENRAEDYLILDEDHFSQLETERADEFWESLGISGRLEFIQRHNDERTDYCGCRVSPFASRHEWCPSCSCGYLDEMLRD